MKPSARLAWFACLFSTGCTSWTAIPMETSVTPHAQIWIGSGPVEVRNLSIGEDSLSASTVGEAPTLIAIARGHVDSVRVRRFDVLKSGLTVAGFAAAALTVAGLSVEYGF